MIKDVTPSPTTTLEMRHEQLAKGNQLLAGLLDEHELAWWQEAQQRLEPTADAKTGALLSSLCKRHLREQAVPDSPAWSTIELARVLLMAQVLVHQPHEEVLRQLFHWGDDREKAALLKALDWFDRHGSCLELALLAGRTSNPQVFAALALDTPYPLRHYPERAFQQLVLKALGMGLDVSRLVGLEQRHGVDLNQLALDLLDEQLAAERAVSPGLPRLIAFDLLSPAQRQRLAGLYQQQRLPTEWREYLAEP